MAPQPSPNMYNKFRLLVTTSMSVAWYLRQGRDLTLDADLDTLTIYFRFVEGE
jgi:hypothetical protein